jgi:hypothetical protein
LGLTFCKQAVEAPGVGLGDGSVRSITAGASLAIPSALGSQTITSGPSRSSIKLASDRRILLASNRGMQQIEL